MDDQQQERKWVPLGNCLAVWMRQPAPADPKRTMPLPPTWTPPSQDPYYTSKWARIRAGGEA